MKLQITEILKAKKIKQKDLADSLGVASEALSRIIGNKGNPTLATLEKIAEALNVELTELFSPSNDDVNGIIRIGNKFHEITSLNDLKTLLDAKTEKSEIKSNDFES